MNPLYHLHLKIQMNLMYYLNLKLRIHLKILGIPRLKKILKILLYHYHLSHLMNQQNLKILMNLM